MAKINPRDITIKTKCYAAVEAEIGIHCGRIEGWRLYSLANPAVSRTLSQNPNEVLVAFTTRKEMAQWYKAYCGAPLPKPEPEYPTLFDNQPNLDKKPKKSGQASLQDLIDEQREEAKLKTVGSGPNKLIISQIL